MMSRGFAPSCSCSGICEDVSTGGHWTLHEDEYELFPKAASLQESENVFIYIITAQYYPNMIPNKIKHKTHNFKSHLIIWEVSALNWFI